MKGILADVNIEGQVYDLVETFFRSEEWIEIWNSIGIPSLVFKNIGLDRRTTDDVVWQTCQENGLVLITGNRNGYGPTSLSKTILDRLTADSLPVITNSQPKSIGLNAQYTAQAGIKMLDYLMNIDKYLGTGRLYVP